MRALRWPVEPKQNSIEGLAASVVLGHALFAAGTKAAFGAAGGALGMAIAVRLRHHGVITQACPTR